MGKVLMAIFMLGLLSVAAAGETPHQAASRCFDRHTADCENACALCHEQGWEMTLSPEDPIGPAGFYADFFDSYQPSRQAESVGDLPLCLQCHPEQATPGHNHPVGILYPHDPAARQLVPYPDGPKLFCDDSGAECWILCSTCHNPHLADRKLVRRKTPGAPLCLACHIK